jgi:hypothetical protein
MGVRSYQKQSMMGRTDQPRCMSANAVGPLRDQSPEEVERRHHGPDAAVFCHPRMTDALVHLLRLDGMQRFVQARGRAVTPGSRCRRGQAPVILIYVTN